MPCRLEGRFLNNQGEASKVRFLTHILDKTVDNLECFRCSRPGLVLGESIYPL